MKQLSLILLVLLVSACTEKASSDPSINLKDRLSTLVLQRAGSCDGTLGTFDIELSETENGIEFVVRPQQLLVELPIIQIGLVNTQTNTFKVIHNHVVATVGQEIRGTVTLSDLEAFNVVAIRPANGGSFSDWSNVVADAVCVLPQLPEPEPLVAYTCDGTLGSFDVFLTAGQDSAYVLQIVPYQLAVEAPIVQIGIVNSFNNTYKILLDQVVARPNQVMSAPLSYEELLNFNYLALRPYTGGAFHDWSNVYQDAVCVLQMPDSSGRATYRPAPRSEFAE